MAINQQICYPWRAKIPKPSLLVSSAIKSVTNIEIGDLNKGLALVSGMAAAALVNGLAPRNPWESLTVCNGK